MKLLTVLNLILILGLLVGCAGTSELITDSSPRNPTTSVEFYREGTKPERKYREIGEVQTEDFGGEEAPAKKRLIERAKQLGANGLIMLPRSDTGYHFNPFGRSGNKYIYKAIAVVYE